MGEKKYGLLTTMSIVVGVIIGIGIFFKHNIIMNNVDGSQRLAITSWIIGYVLVLLAAITVSSLADKITTDGGMQLFIEMAWGKRIGLVVGYFQTYIAFPATMVGISFYVGDFVAKLLKDYEFASKTWFPIVVTVLIVVLLILINLLSKFGSILQQVATYLKLIPIIAIVVAGLFFVRTTSVDAINAAKDYVPSGKSGLVLIGRALIPILFALDGWLVVTTLAGEIDNPKKNLPRAIIGGVTVVGIAYLLFTFFLLKIAPGNAYASGNYSFFNALQEAYGVMIANVLSVFVVISGIGVANGYTMATFSARKGLHYSDVQNEENKKELARKSAIQMSFVLVAYLVITSVVILLNSSFRTNIMAVLTDGVVPFLWTIYVLIFIGIAKMILTKQVKLSKFYVLTAAISTIVGIYVVVVGNGYLSIPISLGIFVAIISTVFIAKKYS